MVLIVLLYFSICLGQFTSLFHNLESIRFEMLQNQYANEVEIIVYNHQKDRWMKLDYDIIWKRKLSKKRRKHNYFLF